MVHTRSMQSPRRLRIHSGHGYSNLMHADVMRRTRIHLLSINLTSHGSRQDSWSLQLLSSVHGPIAPVSSRCKILLCRSVMLPGGGNETSILKSATLVLARSCDALHGSPLILKLIPAVCVIAFAAWGVGPLMRLGRILFLNRTDSNWKKSDAHYITTSYIQPLLLWTGATLICRALDPIVLPSEASQAVKQRLLIFVRSLSTVLAFAYCLSSLIQQVQKFFIETNDSTDARNMGFDFAGKAVYTAVWVAAVSLFMELLGFSTQKWVTAGGLGTVLLTLAGREIFTNFLSSVMIHATRPFVVNEWIQTKIEGYEVSGTVEHVGWWSPTIIRGDDREAVHIPNHKFTVNVVRNLSQKTHWRIKSYIAISHLDVNKINNIVADMRKVLAKNPQVEQQRLHRRVFLENINPENQALMILISCFVKTSHFEEYLCVKEAIMLDLLRVVSHHRARLATPIRTVQKIYSEADLDNIPFADTIFSRSRASTNRPLLLIDHSYKVNGDDKSKASTRSVRSNEEKDAKQEAASTADIKTPDKVGSTTELESKKDDKVMVKNETAGNEDNIDLKSEDTTTPREVIPEKPLFSSSEAGSERVDSKASVSLRTKQDDEKAAALPTIPRPVIEENIVLGVALEGSKRTLPIEEEMAPSPYIDSKEMAPSPAVPNATQID